MTVKNQLGVYVGKKNFLPNFFLNFVLYLIFGVYIFFLEVMISECLFSTHFDPEWAKIQRFDSSNTSEGIIEVGTSSQSDLFSFPKTLAI